MSDRIINCGDDSRVDIAPNFQRYLIGLKPATAEMQSEHNGLALYVH